MSTDQHSLSRRPQPRAKKSLGQHFLRDKNISEKIVKLLHIAEGDRVMEIGPGPGALTSILETTPLAHLLLLEKDDHWAAERQRKGGPHTQAVLMDALTMAWERITPEAPWKIISNLPYNVASPLMWDIFSQATGLTRAVFMIQKEVGDRLVARPDSKDYGALSVWVQSFVRPQWGFVVGPRAFAPPPKVDSAVVAFTPLPAEERPKDPQGLARLVKMCFQNRRKQLGSIFRQNNVPHFITVLERMGISPQLRPENLLPKDFQAILANYQHEILDFSN